MMMPHLAELQAKHKDKSLPVKLWKLLRMNLPHSGN
jgi:hypothetical protein